MQVSKVKILEAEKKRLAFEEVSRAQIVRAVASPKVILLLSLCAPVFLAGAPSPPLLPPLQIPSFSLLVLLFVLFKKCATPISIFSRSIFGRSSIFDHFLHHFYLIFNTQVFFFSTRIHFTKKKTCLLELIFGTLLCASGDGSAVVQVALRPSRSARHSTA